LVTADVAGRVAHDYECPVLAKEKAIASAWRWRDATKELPAERGDVLTCTGMTPAGRQLITVGYFCTSDNTFHRQMPLSAMPATHWMPLPPPAPLPEEPK